MSLRNESLFSHKLSKKTDSELTLSDLPIELIGHIMRLPEITYEELNNMAQTSQGFHKAAIQYSYNKFFNFRQRDMKTYKLIEKQGTWKNIHDMLESLCQSEERAKLVGKACSTTAFFGLLVLPVPTLLISAFLCFSMGIKSSTAFFICINLMLLAYTPAVFVGFYETLASRNYDSMEWFRFAHFTHDKLLDDFKIKIV